MKRVIVLLVLTTIFSMAENEFENELENEFEYLLPKHALKSNYQVVYNSLPNRVENFSNIFRKGLFYGRLRLNTFYYDWSKEGSSRNSHRLLGLGGSIIYKSANYKNIDFTTGFYYTKAFFDDTADPVNRLKSGKDALSRFDYSNTGNASIGVVGEAYLRYRAMDTIDMRVGRQRLESFYAKSNDSKMIPNTFDAIVMNSKALKETSINLGYLFQQKLRDHSKSHSLLTYGGDGDSTVFNELQWSQNDDSAMHKGLTYERLKASGVDTNAPLILADIENKSIDNLKLNTSFYSVPNLLSEVMAEANYKMNFDAVSITPAFRYIRQFDNGAGAIGGASYRGQLAGKSGEVLGYKDADSLDSQMIGARVVSSYNNYKVSLGYSYVLDEADLITPWRGFPTSGYTRSMARYNWMANTKSYRLKVVYNGNSKGIYNHLYTQGSILHTNADESKGYADENYYYLGFIKNFSSLDNMQVRLRVGYNDSEELDADSVDTRFEINYQF